VRNGLASSVVKRKRKRGTWKKMFVESHDGHETVVQLL
jgi:thiamine phosphate synthase YjbQ (UPF0047 family)